MQITVDIDEVKFLMKSHGYKDYRALWCQLKDVGYDSFWRLMEGKTKTRTHLHITVRIAQALNVPVENIIKEIE